MENLEKRVTELENTISTLLQHIKDVNQSITSGFEKVDKNFDKINEKIDSISGNVETIRGKSKATLETVEIKLDNLTSEIKKINDVSGYENLYSNNQGLKIVKNSNS